MGQKNCFRAKTKSQGSKETETGLQMTKWLKMLKRGPKSSQVIALKAMLGVKIDESGPKTQGQKWKSWSPNGEKIKNLSLPK